MCVVLAILLAVGFSGCAHPRPSEVRAPAPSSSAMGIPTQARAQAAHPITTKEITAVVQAIEDEIYDYGYYEHYFQLGENVGSPMDWKARLPIYIDPDVSADGVGHAIYKLMPFGEVFRAIALRADGTVLLVGDPQHGFPPTQPSVRTVFMDDVEVCRLKATWRKRDMQVWVSPSAAMLNGAAERQKARIGFSDWEYRHRRIRK